MILDYCGKKPVIRETCFVAPNATVIGHTILEEDVNIWFGAVIRGDVNQITIGERTNVQDNAVIHVDQHHDTCIGSDVTIGHGAIVHGCHIGKETLVGMGAIVLDGAVIGECCIIGAGALVPQGKTIPPFSLVIGSPGKVVRTLMPEEISSLKESAEKYVKYSKEYLK